MAINFNIRQNLTAIGVVVVAGLAVAIRYIGISEIIDFITVPFRQTEVHVQVSPERPITHQKVSLNLDGTESERVYWLLDEGETALRGGVELQYVFNFDPQSPQGIEHYRRVDAFYKKDGQYQAVTKRVRVTNFPIVADATIESDHLKLTAASELENERQLSGASLAKYVDGEFDVVERVPIDFVRTVGGKAGEEISEYTWNLQDAAKALGYQSKEDLKQKIADDKVWFSLDYDTMINDESGNQQLQMFEPWVKVR